MTAHNRGRGKGVRWICEHVSYSGCDCLIWPYSRKSEGYGNFGLFGETWREQA